MSTARWFQIRLVLPLNLYRLARKFIISVISQARFMRAFLYSKNLVWKLTWKNILFCIRIVGVLMR